MKRLAVYLIMIVLLVPGMSRAGQELRIGRPCFLSRCDFFEVEEVLKEAYRRIGKEVSFVSLPPLRELDLADTGEIDGCLARLSSVTRPYENLTRVDYPILRYVVVACFVREDVVVNELEDLQRYRVGILGDLVVPELLCQRAGVVPMAYTKLASGLRMLEEGRIDLILEEKTLARIGAEALGMALRYSEPLYLGYAYHWLNDKHFTVAEELAGVLRQMAAEGTTRRLLGRYSGMVCCDDLED